MLSLRSHLIGANNNIVDSTDICDSFKFGEDIIKKYLLKNFTDYTSLQDKTIISPNNLPQIQQFSNAFFDWHRYPFSGRSFSKGYKIDNKLYEVVVKGGHLLEYDKIRDPKISIYAPPARGSETVQQLYKEYNMAEYIQNTSLAMTGALAPIPLPLKVSKLDTYKYQDKIIDYKEFMNMIFCEYDSHWENLLHTCIAADLGIHESKAEKPGSYFIKDEYFNNVGLLLEKYRDAIGEHGSYIYMCQGTSMRLADVFMAPTKQEMQSIIKSYYPETISNEEICISFMNNFGKARGLISGAGLYYKDGKISICYAVDTTIMGHVMDIDGYTYHGTQSFEEFQDMINKQQLYIEICLLLHSIFFQSSSDQFLSFYEKHCLKVHIDSFNSVQKHRGLQINTADLSTIMLGEAKAYLDNCIIKNKNLATSPRYLGNIVSCIKHLYE